MTNLYIIAGAVIVLVAIVAVLKMKFEGGDEEQKKYQYKKRDFFMTRAEHECYDALVSAVGSEYLIFAQAKPPNPTKKKKTKKKQT